MTTANGILDASALSDLGAGAAARFGKFGVIGDSHMAGGYAGASMAKRVAYQSSGRFTYAANFAVGGKRSDEILNEQVPQLIASGLKLAIMDTGYTNDRSQGVSIATSRANSIAIWTALRGAGIYFVDVGVLPSNVSTTVATAHADYELWAQQYCAKNGIHHVNAFIALATPSGGFISGTNEDNTHANSVGARIVADKIIAVLERTGTVSPLLELIDRAAASTLILSNAVGFGGVASALPSGYNTVGTGPTFSVLAPDSGEQNRWLRATYAGANAVAGFSGTTRAVATMGWAQGDKIAIACLLRWSATDPVSLLPRLNPITSFTSVVTLPYDEEGGTSGDSIYAYGEYLVPSGANAGMQFQASTTAAGYFEISRPIMYNLTANGLA